MVDARFSKMLLDASRHEWDKPIGVAKRDIKAGETIEIYIDPNHGWWSPDIDFFTTIIAWRDKQDGSM